MHFIGSTEDARVVATCRVWMGCIDDLADHCTSSIRSDDSSAELSTVVRDEPAKVCLRLSAELSTVVRDEPAKACLRLLVGIHLSQHLRS